MFTTSILEVTSLMRARERRTHDVSMFIYLFSAILQQFQQNKLKLLMICCYSSIVNVFLCNWREKRVLKTRPN